MTLLAYSRPFWPLFLHVLGAMTLWGTTLAALVLAVARLPRATLVTLVVALPGWALTLGGGYWIESKEGFGDSSPTWLALGHGILEPGVVVLLLALGSAYRWSRSGKPAAARTTAALAGIYLVLLTVALLAMSGKWS